MAKTFTAVPLGADLGAAAAFGSDYRTARLVSVSAIDPDGLPFILVRDQLFLAGGPIELAIKDIKALSFDGDRWWWPFGRSENGEDEEPSDDPGEMAPAKVDELMADLKRLLDGRLTSVLCEQRFHLLGLTQTYSDDFHVQLDSTDDAGEESAG